MNISDKPTKPVDNNGYTRLPQTDSTLKQFDTSIIVCMLQVAIPIRIRRIQTLTAVQVCLY